MSTHRLTKSRRGDYHLLIGPYDADLVAKLRGRIPTSDRQWDPGLKAWRIHPRSVDQVQEWIDGMEDDAERDPGLFEADFDPNVGDR